MTRGAKWKGLTVYERRKVRKSVAHPLARLGGQEQIVSDPTLGPQSGASSHPLRCERLFPVQTGASGLDSSSWDLILELEEQMGGDESSFWPVGSGVEGLRPQLLSHRTGMPRRRRRLGDWSLILLCGGCLPNTRSLPDKTKRSFDTPYFTPLALHKRYFMILA